MPASILSTENHDSRALHRVNIYHRIITEPPLACFRHRARNSARAYAFSSRLETMPLKLAAAFTVTLQTRLSRRCRFTPLASPVWHHQLPHVTATPRRRRRQRSRHSLSSRHFVDGSITRLARQHVRFSRRRCALYHLAAIYSALFSPFSSRRKMFYYY